MCHLCGFGQLSHTHNNNKIVVVARFCAVWSLSNSFLLSRIFDLFYCTRNCSKLLLLVASNLALFFIIFYYLFYASVPLVFSLSSSFPPLTHFLLLLLKSILRLWSIASIYPLSELTLRWIHADWLELPKLIKHSIRNFDFSMFSVSKHRSRPVCHHAAALIDVYFRV